MSDTRERILTCACDLYLEDGFEGFSMRKLARSVGVTAPALYRHFEGKEQLLLEVVGEAYKVMIQYLHRAMVGEDAVDRFRRAGNAYLEFALEQPRYYEILYSYTQFLGLDELPDEVRDLVAGIHQFWLDRVRECMDAEFLKRDDPEATAQAFWALSHGLISIHQRGMLGCSEEEFRRMYGEAAGRLLKGVGAPPGGVGDEGLQEGGVQGGDVPGRTVPTDSGPAGEAPTETLPDEEVSLMGGVDRMTRNDR